MVRQIKCKIREVYGGITFPFRFAFTSNDSDMLLFLSFQMIDSMQDMSHFYAIFRKVSIVPVVPLPTPGAI